MKITIAIDSFKGSLTSLQAGTAVSEGIRLAYPDSENIILPVAGTAKITQSCAKPIKIKHFSIITANVFLSAYLPQNFDHKE